MKKILLPILIIIVALFIIAAANSRQPILDVGSKLCENVTVSFINYPLRENWTVVIYVDGHLEVVYVSPGEILRRIFAVPVEPGEHLVSVSVYYVPGEPVGMLIFFDYVTVAACTSATPTSPHLPPPLPHPKPWGPIVPEE